MYEVMQDLHLQQYLEYFRNTEVILTMSMPSARLNPASRQETVDDINRA